jgi:hypothetical protein
MRTLDEPASLVVTCYLPPLEGNACSDDSRMAVGTTLARKVSRILKYPRIIRPLTYYFSTL